MARYRKVSIRMWGDAKVRQLSAPPPNGRDCFMYLVTARESTNIPGLVPAGAAAIAETLRWSIEGFLQVFGEVARIGLAQADWEAGLVWVPKAILHNEPENPNVVKSWGETWDDLIPECALKLQAYEALRAYCAKRGPNFLAAFDEAVKRPDVPTDEPTPNPSGNVPGTLTQTLSPTLAESGTGTGTGAGDPLPARARENESLAPENDSPGDFERSPAGRFLAWADSVNPNLWQKPPDRSGFVRWYAGAIRDLSKRGMADSELRAAYERFCSDAWAQGLSPPCPWNAWLRKWTEFLASEGPREADPAVEQPDTPAGRTWAATLDRLRADGKTLAVGYLQRLVPVGLHGHQLELEAPDPHLGEFVREQYGGLLADALADDGLLPAISVLKPQPPAGGHP